MGSASSGPLLIADAEGVSRSALTFVDIRTLKPLTIEGSARRGVHLGDGANLRASADGRVFGVWGTAHSPSGLETYVLTGNTMKSHYEHASVGHVIPSPDGKVIYTGAGLYTNEVKKLGGREATNR